MRRFSLIFVAAALGCSPRGDQWTEADIRHADTDTPDGEDEYGFLVGLLVGEVEIIPKTSIEGSVEFIAGLYNPTTDDLEDLGCVIDLEIRSDDWRADCDPCEEAYDFSATSFSVHVDDGTCSDFGFTEEFLSDFEVALGFGSNLLYYSEEPSEWDVVAETAYSEGFTRFEWVLDLD